MTDVVLVKQITEFVEVVVRIGLGLIVTVNVLGVPIHEPNEGVTVIMDVIAVVPELVPIKVGVLLVPLAANPIDGFELVQVNVAPAGVLVKDKAAMEFASQTTIFDGTATVGEELAVIAITSLKTQTRSKVMSSKTKSLFPTIF